eukprot:COSAG02_NODE_11584_length_1693_cov_220.543915_2_plen_107_part_00
MFSVLIAGDPTNYLNAVIVVLKGVEGSEAGLKEYEKVRDKYNEEYADQVQTHKKTDRQKEIWIDWPDYLEIVGRLQKDTIHHLALSFHTNITSFRANEVRTTQMCN